MSRELTVRPMALRQAREFVELHHRHHGMPQGGLWALALMRGDELVGVAIAGRPVSRVLERRGCCEIVRVCVLEGVRNGCSMLYGRCRRVAQAMGYRQVVTYTQGGESGASLRAAGFQLGAKLKARASWAEASVSLRAIRDPQGSGGVERLRWEG